MTTLSALDQPPPERRERLPDPPAPPRPGTPAPTADAGPRPPQPLAASADRSRSRSRARRERPRRWDSVLLGLLLAVVLLAPLPLGSNRPVPAALLATAVGALLLAWGTGALLSAAKPAVSVRSLWPGVLLFGLAAAWAALQALPLAPPALHHPAWAAAGEALGAPVGGAISVNPEATWTRLAGLLAYGGVFWLALQLGGSTERVRRILLALAVAGLLYAVYGFLVYFGGIEPVPWLNPFTGRERLSSTFVNPNAFATYAGLTLLCGLGLVAHEVGRHVRDGAPLPRIARRVLSRLDAPMAIGALTVLLCGTALLLTGSRGALVALCPALVVFAALLRHTIGRSRAIRLAVALLLAALLIGLLQLAGERTLERFEHAAGNVPDRLAYYRTTWRAALDRPLLGTGYGTYADAFQAHNHPGTGTAYLDKAHNTWLQLAMELGWPAALALFLAVGYLVWRCLRGLHARPENAAYPAVVVAASVLVGVHALVDFSLEMPAIAATYALLLGLGCAQALREPRPGRASRRPTQLDEEPTPAATGRPVRSARTPSPPSPPTTPGPGRSTASP